MKSHSKMFHISSPTECVLHSYTFSNKKHDQNVTEQFDAYSGFLQFLIIRDLYTACQGAREDRSNRQNNKQTNIKSLWSITCNDHMGDSETCHSSHLVLRTIQLIGLVFHKPLFSVPQNRNTELICTEMHSIITVQNLPFDNQPVQERIRI